MYIEFMVRVEECFECGIKEHDAKLVYTKDKPVLCEKCHKKSLSGKN